MNRRLASSVLGIALGATITVLDGSQTPGQIRSAEKRAGEVTRIHHDKGRSQGRPDWVAAAVGRGRKHLAEAKEEAGLENPEAELVLDSVIEDDLGQTHLRFDQTHKGLPVFGSQVVVELDETSGNKIFGKGDPSARIVDIAPAITGEMAIEFATTALGYSGQFASPPAAKLVILPAAEDRASATLTWLVELGIDDGSEATAQHRYFVSAQNGDIVMHYDALNHASGKSYYSGTVSIVTTLATLNDGKYLYRMWDKTRNFYTTDMRTAVDGPGTLFSNATNVWGNTSPFRDIAGVDAHFGVTKAWDYFRQRLAWTGIDGAGQGVINRVHYGVGEAAKNASQLYGVLSFGDGDGVTVRPLVSVDIVAHEYTHAIVWRTANLQYVNQSGALNESFADIFGTAVEFYTGIRPDYTMGEDIGIQKPHRSLANPPMFNQPDHMSQYYGGVEDYGGVHINSGIPNKAFYLLAEGGTHPLSRVYVARVGRPAAEWIFFRALRKLTPYATFSQARAAVLSAAADGYGLYSPQWYSTKAAWDAVGVN